MSSSLPYSVVTTQYKVLPSLKVVGDLDVSGNLTVDGLTTANGGILALGTNYINGTLQIGNSLTLEGGCELLTGPFPQTAGTVGQYLTSQGSTQSPIWSSVLSVAPVRFFGRLTAGQVIPNTTLTQITTYTSNVVNTGSGFNSATGRFTCGVAGNFNLFAQIMFLFDTGVGFETNIYMRIYNSANVLQETFISQNYNPTTPTFFVIVNSLNINYYMNSGDYAIILAYMSAGGGTRTVTEKSYFGGSRFSDTY